MSRELLASQKNNSGILLDPPDKTGGTDYL